MQHPFSLFFFVVAHFVFFSLKCQQEYFNLFSDESTEKQFAMTFSCISVSLLFSHLRIFWAALWFSSLVNIFRVHPQLLQITDFSITIYFDMYFYAILDNLSSLQPKAPTKNSLSILHFFFARNLHHKLSAMS